MCDGVGPSWTTPVMTTRISIVICAIAVAGCGDDAHSFTLSLAAEGTGRGDVIVDNDAEQMVLCSLEPGSTCTGALEADANVLVTAHPSVGSQFIGFGGDCESGANPLSFVMSSDRACTVVFETP